MSYDAVVVSKEEPNLPRLIEDLKRQTVRPHRIICVVKGRTKVYSGYGVEVIHQPDDSPAGPAAARNTGARAAGCEIIIGFDGDVRVPPDYAEKALKLLESTGANIIGGCNYGIGGPLDRFNFYLLSFFSWLLDVRGKASIIGNNYVVYRHDLLQVPFRVDISMIEDADLARQFRKAKKEVRFLRELYVRTKARRVHELGGWWRYLVMYAKAYKEYQNTGTVKRFKYF